MARKKWLKKLGKGALAVSTGGASLIAKKVIPKTTLNKIGRGALAVSTGGASLAFKKARPNYVAPAQRNTASKPIVQVSARQPQPAQRGAMRAVRPTSAKPFNPVQRNAMRAVRPASAQPFNPAQRGEIVGYNAESKEVIRSNQQGGSTPRISIVINNNNNTPTNPIKKVVDKKTGKPLVAQRAK